MPGLLERAQSLIVTARTTGPAPEATPQRDSGVSADEQRELLSQIERLFTDRHHIEPSGQTKGSRGITFPLAVNLSAAALLLIAVVAFGSIASSANQRRASETANYLATEGLVVKAVKQQAAQELNAREARIAEIKRQLASLRAAAHGAVGSEAAARQKQLESELASLQSSTSARLSALAVQRQQQEFLLRQFQAIYQNIAADVAAGDTQRALLGISSADSLLQKSTVQPNGEISAVAPALYAGNAVLRAALLYGQSAAKAAQSPELAGKLAEIDRLIGRGDERYQAGQYKQAGEFYTKALTSLDNLARAYGRMQAMTKDAYDLRIRELTSATDKMKQNITALEATIGGQRATIAEQQSRIGDLNGMVAGQQAANAKQQATIAEQDNRLSAQEARIKDEAATIAQQRLDLLRRTEQLAAVVSSVKRSIALASPAAEKGSGLRSRELVSLLQTKVAIRGLADSAVGRKSYPGLYDKLNAFFNGYADVYETQGRQAAFREVASALNDVIVSLNLRLPSNPAIPSSSPAAKAESTSVPLTRADNPISGYLGRLNDLFSGMLARVN